MPRWEIVTANSFPVDSGIERVRGEEHAKALVEFAYCYLRQNLVSENPLVFTDFQWVTFHLNEKSPSRTVAAALRPTVLLIPGSV